MSCLRIRSSSRSSGPSYTWPTITENGDCSASSSPRLQRRRHLLGSLLLLPLFPGQTARLESSLSSPSPASALGQPRALALALVRRAEPKANALLRASSSSKVRLVSAIVSSACAALLPADASSAMKASATGSQLGAAASALTSAFCTSTSTSTAGLETSALTGSPGDGSSAPASASATSASATPAGCFQLQRQPQPSQRQLPPPPAQLALPRNSLNLLLFSARLNLSQFGLGQPAPLESHAISAACSTSAATSSDFGEGCVNSVSSSGFSSSFV